MISSTNIPPHLNEVIVNSLIASKVQFTPGEDITEEDVQNAIIELNQYANIKFADKAETDASNITATSYKTALNLPADTEAELSTKADKSEWGLPDGGLEFDGVDNYAILSKNVINKSNSIEVYFRLPDISGTVAILNAYLESGERFYFEYSQTLENIRCEFRVGNIPIQRARFAFTPIANKWYHIIYTYKAGFNKMYLDGIEQTLIEDVSTGDELTVNADLKIGILNVTAQEVDIAMLKAGNQIITNEQATQAYNNGRPDLAGLPDGVAYADVTEITSGTLTVGTKYVIKEYITGDDFTNVGATNESGNAFTATGATPTTWTNSSVLQEAGCLLEYKPHSFSNTGIKDLSGNNIHGEVSGPKQLGRPKATILRDNSVTADVTHTDGYSKTEKITGYRIVNNTANAVTIDVGTTASGTDIINGLVVGASVDITDSLDSVFDTDKDIYISSSAWNSANLEITLYKELL